MADDVRNLMPIAQALVDIALPMAQAATIDGDFTITLHVKRRGDRVFADTDVTLRGAGRRR